MEKQLEDDLRRVLRLARLETRTRHGKTSKRTSTAVSAVQPQRHRHERELAKRGRPTLLNTKLQSLSAVYGLDRNSHHLADCSSKSVFLHRQPEDPEDDVELQRRLEARRARYKQHFSGALAAAGGRSRQLEELLEAAAREARVSRAVGVGIGAAVLTESQTIFAAGAVESGSLTLCAERAAVLKMLTSTNNSKPRGTYSPTVAALAICSEQRALLPFPCGACRELLADCGDFPVYLVNALGESDETRSSALFPRARDSQLTQHVTQTCTSKAQVQPRPSTTPVSSKMLSEAPLEVKNWTPQHVVQWLERSVELPQYCQVFERHAVDGCTLVLLEASDLTLLLGITQPLHRSKLLAHIDRLRDRELLARGLDYTQLEDYLAVLDADRVSAVAHLKATFDRLDADRDGFLDFTQLRRALESLRCTIPPALYVDEASKQLESSGSDPVEASAQAVERLLHSEALFGAEAAKTGKVAFPAFARAFSKLALQPADSTSVTRGDFAVHALGPRLPVLDLLHLRESFERHAGSGDVNVKLNESALARLLQSLAQSESQSTKLAHEWLADPSGSQSRGESLDFAQFIVHYADLMESTESGVETVEPRAVARLQQLFQSFEPVRSTRWKPRRVLSRALTTLFPAVPTDEVSVWCASYWASRGSALQSLNEDGQDVTKRRRKTLSFPEFVLACLQFAVEMEKREQEAEELKLTLRNDALAHRSRVVHLHQSGHVRLCPQPRGETAELSTRQPIRESRAKAEEKRTRHLRPRRSNQRGPGSEEDDGKRDDEERKTADSEDDDDDDTSRRNQPKGSREKQVNEAFARFARRRQKSLCEERDEGKHDSEDESSDETAGVLNAVEAAQAALELGAALSRAQVLRFLEREGLGSLCKREISRSAFQRLMKRLDANQAKPRELLQLNSATVPGRQSDSSREIHDRRGKSRRTDQSPRRAYCSRQDYDDFLRQQHAKRAGNRWQEEVEALRREQQRKEGRRERRTHRRRRRSRDSEDDGKHESSSSSDENGVDPRHTRRSTRRARQNRQRSRSRRTRSSRPRRCSSSFSSTTDTEDSSAESSLSSSRVTRPGGFHPGTRVASMVHGRGTVERVYREFFVADVHFDSGRRVRNVELGNLRVLDPEVDQLAWPPTQSFKVGTAVSVAHRGTKTRRRGKIVVCRTDGSFDVLLNEFGEAQTLRRVARHELQLWASQPAKPAIYRDGASVTVRQRTEYLRGRVCMCRSDGSYDVKLLRPPQKVLTRLAPELLAPDDAGDVEDVEDVEDDKDESDEDNRPKGAERPKKASRRADSDEDSFEPEFARGDRVEARFGGQAAYYAGTVERVNADGSCAISYDDGDEEERVAAHLIRALAPRATPEPRKTASSSLTKRRTSDDSDDYEEDLFESD